ncbi:MAG: methyltransferase domain-containing protein [Pseudomonadota bacterium]
MTFRHKIKFASNEASNLDQNEVFFFLNENGKDRKFRFHDYEEIFSRAGLYEQIFYDRLRCSSPRKVAENLKNALDANQQPITEMRVMDLGAGNGIMGEVLRNYGVSRLVGVDIIPEAKDAADRDRPGVYDEYYVEDFCALGEEVRTELNDWSIDCLTSVAALGFDDIPVKAFWEAINFVQDGGWVAFNIKETFLDNADNSGFSRFIRELIFSEYLDIHQLERYRHRLSIDGAPLYYFSLVAQKMAGIPEKFLLECDIH